MKKEWARHAHEVRRRAARLGPAPDGRARLHRALLSRGVRRSGRRRSAPRRSHSGSGGLSMGLAVHTDMVPPPDRDARTQDQKRRYLEPGIKGEKIGALGITEPEPVDAAGIDPARSGRRRVRGQRLEDVHHQRRPCGGSIVLVTKTCRPTRRNPTLFIDVDKDVGDNVPGFSVSRTLEKMGMHAPTRRSSRSRTFGYRLRTCSAGGQGLLPHQLGATERRRRLRCGAERAFEKTL